MICYELKEIEIFKTKGVDYRCILWNMTYDEAFNLLNNSKLDERDSLWMEFNPDKTPIEVIKEGTLGTYFRDIYSGVNKQSYSNWWKELKDLKNIVQSINIA